MKNYWYIAFLVFATTPSFAQKNLNFERWDINYFATDEAKNWVNTSDASSYGAPKVVFKEVENPADGLASVKLVTAYWSEGSNYDIDTLIGALLQQSTFNKTKKF